MAGTLVIDTLKSSTTGAPTFQNTSGTEVGQLCKAWVNFNGSTGARSASFNVSSVTVGGTGTYTINFTTAFADTNYAFVGGSKADTDGSGFAAVMCQRLSDAKSTTSITLRAMNTSMGLVTPTDAHLAFFR